MWEWEEAEGSSRRLVAAVMVEAGRVPVEVVMGESVAGRRTRGRRRR